MSGERLRVSFRRRRDSLNVGRHDLLEYHVERSDMRNRKVKIQSFERNCEDWHFVTGATVTAC